MSLGAWPWQAPEGLERPCLQARAEQGWRRAVADRPPAGAEEALLRQAQGDLRYHWLLSSRCLPRNGGATWLHLEDSAQNVGRARDLAEPH